jgi:hypothetical protein
VRGHDVRAVGVAVGVCKNSEQWMGVVKVGGLGQRNYENGE